MHNLTWAPHALAAASILILTIPAIASDQPAAATDRRVEQASRTAARAPAQPASAAGAAAARRCQQEASLEYFIGISGRFVKDDVRQDIDEMRERLDSLKCEQGAVSPRPDGTALATPPRNARATSAGTQTLLCRGGRLLQLSELPAGTNARPRLTLAFRTAAKAPTADGRGLAPSECALLGHTGHFPPHVRFEPGSADVRQRLARDDQYWSFSVRPGDGYYDAVTNAPLDPPSPHADPAQVIQGQAPARTPALTPR